MPHIELPAGLAGETERLASLAREQSAENEQARALSPELVRGLREAGLLRAGAPAQLGALRGSARGHARVRGADRARRRLGRLVRVDRLYLEPAGRLDARAGGG